MCRNVTWSLSPIAGGPVYLGQSGWVFFRITTGLSQVLGTSLRGIGIFALREVRGLGKGWMDIVWENILRRNGEDSN